MININPTVTKIIRSVAIPAFAFSLYAANAQASKPDVFEKNDTIQNTTNTINSISNKLIVEDVPYIDYYNNLPVSSKAAIRWNAFAKTDKKIMDLTTSLMEIGVFDNTFIQQILTAERPAGLKTDIKAKIDDVNNVPAVQNNALKELEVLPLSDVVITKDQAIEAFYNYGIKTVESIKNYGGEIDGAFNYYYDTLTGLKVIVEPEEADKFFVEATGKNAEQLAEEFMSTPDINKAGMLKSVITEVNQKEKLERDSLTENGCKRYADTFKRFMDTYESIEKMEKSTTGLTTNLSEVFGNNMDIVSVTDFLDCVNDSYNEYTTGIKEQTASETDRKPGKNRDGKPFVAKVNGQRTFIQKITTVKSDKSVETKYYDVYHNGIEVNPADIR